jgi:hypothetical protein
MLVTNVTHPAICIDSRIEFWYFVPCGGGGCVCVCVGGGRVFSFYLKMTRTKKLASKQ